MAVSADAGSAAPPAARPLLSPAGYVVTAAAMAVTAVVVYLVTAHFRGGGAPSGPVLETYEEIVLGPISRELAADAAGLLREEFMIHVVLVLNPRRRNLAEVKAQVERRRNLLRDIVSTEIVYAKTEAELRRPGVLEALKAEIKARVNAELGGAGDGQEVVLKVIFPESKVPARRG
ncbi:MAG: flagellar basal body-associated FliL family protein [Planctomycetota bacterium]